MNSLLEAGNGSNRIPILTGTLTDPLQGSLKHTLVGTLERNSDSVRCCHCAVLLFWYFNGFLSSGLNTCNRVLGVTVGRLQRDSTGTLLLPYVDPEAANRFCAVLLRLSEGNVGC